MFLELKIIFVIVEIQKIMRKSYISLSQTVSCQKRAYFDVTSGDFAKFDSEKVHEDEIFGQQNSISIFLRRIQSL